MWPLPRRAKGRPFGITSLREIQLSKRDVLDTLAKARREFTTEEWKSFCCAPSALKRAP
jgi:ATP-dependent Lon protease